MYAEISEFSSGFIKAIPLVELANLFNSHRAHKFDITEMGGFMTLLELKSLIQLGELISFAYSSVLIVPMKCKQLVAQQFKLFNLTRNQKKNVLATKSAMGTLAHQHFRKGAKRRTLTCTYSKA